ncbi:MAG: Protein TolB [Anaerolineales bacterium]|nr:Protein TolB [Anaerolineales bacterium]
MIRKCTLAGLFLLVALGWGAPVAQTAPAAQTETLPFATYLPLVARNTMEPVIGFASDRDGGSFDVYVMNPRYLGVRNVTRWPEADDMAPAFGPGGLLAWASRRDGNWEIYSGDVFGRSARRLTFDSGVDYGPTWSPEGQRIAFSSGRAGSMDVWDMKADGTELRRLTDAPSQQRQPAWSPDGSKIAYVSDQGGNDNIYIMNADGSNKDVLRDLATSHEQFPAWSPDGDWVVFSTNMDGRWELTAIHVAEQTLQPVISDAVFDVDGSWSRDGERVVFRSTRGGNTDLYMIDFSGGGLGSGLRRLTSHTATDIEPAWSR